MAIKFRDLFHPKRTSPAAGSPSAAGTAAPGGVQGPGTGQGPAAALDHYRRANEYRIQGRWAAALTEYDRAIAGDPGFANAYCNRGVALENLGRPDDALASYDRAIALQPGDALAHYNRGAVLVRLGRRQAALASYDQAIELRPDYAEAHFNRAVLHHQMRHWPEAIAGFEHAMALNPAFAAEYTWFTLAVAGIESRRWQHALASLDRVLALRADHADALRMRGIVLQQLQRPLEALSSHDAALRIRGDDAEAWSGRGQALHALGRYEEAIASYDRALALRPDLRYLPGMRCSAAMQVCDWRDRDADVTRLSAGIRAGLPVSPPFPLLALLDSAPLQRSAAQIWVREEFPPQDVAPPAPSAHDKIRIGYFSADFRVHPIALLMTELFEVHDRSRFEITAFAFGPEPEAAIGARLARAFDHFIDVRASPDADVAALARRLGIDIAVDLGGFTEYSRTGIFALRAAPVQVSYIGYLGTMGAPYIDYLIADATIVPATDRGFYDEKIVYLPSYQANHARRVVAERSFSRAELGLPPRGFVFACCNSSYKIDPATFDAWMRILGRVEGSVLFLNADNETAERNLRGEARARGIDPARLVFGARLALPEYLARYRSLDLFLDTSPYNAGTTASDALWVGLPVLTRLGTTFAGRMAASLLHAIGLPELVAGSATGYEDLAVALATDPARMAALRAKLALQRDTAPLFDTRRFAAHLESAYERIHARRLRGLPPDHLFPDPEVIVD